VRLRLLQQQQQGHLVLLGTDRTWPCGEVAQAHPPGSCKLLLVHQQQQSRLLRMAAPAAAAGGCLAHPAAWSLAAAAACVATAAAVAAAHTDELQPLLQQLLLSHCRPAYQTNPAGAASWACLHDQAYQAHQQNGPSRDLPLLLLLLGVARAAGAHAALLDLLPLLAAA
jgi:hypothetical protein